MLVHIWTQEKQGETSLEALKIPSDSSNLLEMTQNDWQPVTPSLLTPKGQLHLPLSLGISYRWDSHTGDSDLFCISQQMGTSDCHNRNDNPDDSDSREVKVTCALQLTNPTWFCRPSHWTPESSGESDALIDTSLSWEHGLY